MYVWRSWRSLRNFGSTTALIAKGRGGGYDGKDYQAEALRGKDVGQLGASTSTNLISEVAQLSGRAAEDDDDDGVDGIDNYRAYAISSKEEAALKSGNVNLNLIAIVSNDNLSLNQTLLKEFWQCMAKLQAEDFKHT